MTDQLEALCRAVADRIGDEIEQFEGFDVRADAGEPGMIYVALRDAKDRRDVGERFAEQVASVVEEETGEFALSVGAGDSDLLLQIEIRQ